MIKLILWIIVIGVVCYMALHFLVLAGYFLMWSFHYALPVFVLVVAAVLLSNTKGKR